ncbi:hypothetical protein SteCoe_33143 [Stentor coeruleus]|uniref:PHD-type domain-containing protein n=1 Tax=Stentor coeruleus TaxID=5963 RepID=A0A1R2AXF1_9CILI|nr:hypothetical protein SteCoe_33143 [Stentor coeruleus]
MKNTTKNQSKPICCICGAPNLLKSCTKSGCYNSYHLNCLVIYYPSLDQEEKTCPEHSFKNLKELSRLLCLSCRFNSDKLLHTTVKSFQTPRPHYDLLGKLFWFGISQQYFPNTLLATPNFVDSQQNFLGDPLADTWIQQKINKVLGKLTASTQMINSILTPAKKAYHKTHKNLKSLDYPPDPLHIPMNIRKKFIQNYEKSQLSSYTYEKKDYHSYVSEDKIFCAVCDEGESTEDNLIVICHNCKVPVHCKCYNIKEIPENEWLCNYCVEKVGTDAGKPGQCELCPVTGGALKKAKGNIWVHVTCSRSLQENVMNDSELDVDKIDKKKFKLKCFECNLKTGACVQCSFGRCTSAFHVECRKDLIDKFFDGQIVRFFNIFCPNHKASKLTRIITTNEENAKEYMIGLGNMLWESTVEKSASPEKKKPRGRRERLEKKKRLFVQVTEDKIIVKVFINNKLARIMKYTSEANKSKRKKVIQQPKEDPIRKEKLEIQTVVLKKTPKRPEIEILKTNNESFTIKMKVPQVLINKFFPQKVPKHA